jgi:hypothetical protein
MSLLFFHHRCCYIVGLLVVLVTLLSICRCLDRNPYPMSEWQHWSERLHYTIPSIMILAFSGTLFMYCPFIKQIHLTIWPAKPWWWVGWAFPNLNLCQGQLQTSRSVTVAVCCDECLYSQYWLPLLHCYIILSFQLSVIYLVQSYLASAKHVF